METIGYYAFDRFDRRVPFSSGAKGVMNPGEIPGVPRQQESGKRAVHVKWDGKTIALGTFPIAEAADKCERAKILTKRWRSTMRPKPSVEWVKASLERLQLRVVNDRPGRRKREETIGNNATSTSTNNIHPSQSTTSILSHAGVDSSIDLFQNSLAQGQLSQMTPLPQSKVSSSPQPSQFRRLSNVGASYKGSMSYDPPPPPPTLRGLVASTAASDNGSNQANMGDVVLGSTEHYEVLKRHHFKLLREIQETTNLMNLYHREHMANDVQLQQQGSSMFGQSSSSALNLDGGISTSSSFANTAAAAQQGGGRTAPGPSGISRRRSSLSAAIADNLLGTSGDTRSLSVSSQLQGLNAGDPFSLLVQQQQQQAGRPHHHQQNDTTSILGHQHNFLDNGGIIPTNNNVDALSGSRRPSLTNRMRLEDDLLALTRSRGGVAGGADDLVVQQRETMLKAAILAEQQRDIVERRLSNPMERRLSFPIERRLSNQLERRLSNPIERRLSDAQENKLAQLDDIMQKERFSQV